MTSLRNNHHFINSFAQFINARGKEMKGELKEVQHGLNDLAMIRQATVEVAKQFSEGFRKEARVHDPK